MKKTTLKTLAICAFLLAITVLVTAPSPFDSSAKTGFGLYLFLAAVFVAVGLVFAVKTKSHK